MDGSLWVPASSGVGGGGPAGCSLLLYAVVVAKRSGGGHWPAVSLSGRPGDAERSAPLQGHRRPPFSPTARELMERSKTCGGARLEPGRGSPGLQPASFAWPRTGARAVGRGAEGIAPDEPSMQQNQMVPL